MSKDSLRYYLCQFCKCVHILYGNSFLIRLPSKAEHREIADRYSEVGFKGCIGCVDGGKMKWKNCPHALKGQYHNKNERKEATIAVEAWCDRDLYICHGFAGRRGINNDKTLLEVSPYLSLF